MSGATQNLMSGTDGLEAFCSTSLAGHNENSTTVARALTSYENRSRWLSTFSICKDFECLKRLHEPSSKCPPFASLTSMLRRCIEPMSLLKTFSGIFIMVRRTRDTKCFLVSQ